MVPVIVIRGMATETEAAALIAIFAALHRILEVPEQPGTRIATWKSATWKSEGEDYRAPTSWARRERFRFDRHWAAESSGMPVFSRTCLFSSAIPTASTPDRRTLARDDLRGQAMER